MFDVGFWEICLIALVSLLVIGPEKLPKVARIAGFWVGKTQSVVRSVKAEIQEELYAEELRQTLQEQQQEVENLLSEGSEQVDAINTSVQSISEQGKNINDSK